MNGTAKCRVSVIVPVYRVEKYLERCIRSLMKQTLAEIEILCVCEKEDPSYQTLLAYGTKDIRIHVIEKTNTGVSAARNAGMRVAQGEYIAFVDADDWLERHALERLYIMAERYGAQIIAYGLWPSKEPGRNGRWVFRCTPRRDVLYCGHGVEALFYEQGSRPFVINKFYQAEFLRKNSLFFEESLDIGEDQFFQFTTFGRAETICFLKERLYHYEIGRSDSAMSQCEREQNLQEKNFCLLQAIMEWRKKQKKSQCDEGYAWWILQDYAWVVNQKDPQVTAKRKEQICAIQAWLNELSPDGYVKKLPKDFQQICSRFLDYSGEAEIGIYLWLSYKEFDACVMRETDGLCQPVILPPKGSIWSRRVYEIVVFHEGSHLIMEVLVWLAKKYRDFFAGKKYDRTETV